MVTVKIKFRQNGETHYKFKYFQSREWAEEYIEEQGYNSAYVEIIEGYIE